MTESTEENDVPDGATEDSEASIPAPRRRGCLRAALLFVLVLLLLIAGMGIAWWQGSLPRWIALQALTRTVTAHIDLGTVEMGKTFRIESLSLSQPEHLDTAPSTIYLEGLDVAYSLRPADGRYLGHVKLDLLQLQADEDFDPPTHQWLLDLLAQPGTGSMAFVPRTMHINVFDGGYKAPDFLIGVRDLEVAGAFHGPGHSEFQISGQALQLIEQVMGLYGSVTEADAPGAARTHHGAGDWRMTLRGDAIDTGGRMSFPDTLELEGQANLKRLPKGLSGRLNIDHLTLEQEVWSALASSWLPTPVAFSKLTLDALTASGGVYADAFDVDEVIFEGAAETFRLGPDEGPLLRGDLQLSGEGSSAAGRAAFQGTATLNEAPAITIDFAGVPAEWQLGLRTDTWSRIQLSDHLPALTPLLDALPTLSALDSDFKLLHLDQRNDFALSASGEAATRPIRLEATGTLGGEDALVAGDAELRYSEGQASGPFVFRSIEDFTANVQVTKLNPARWLAGLLKNDAVNALDAPASGQVTLRVAGKTIAFDTTLTLDHLRYDGKAYSEGRSGQFDAKGEYNTETRQSTGQSLRLALGDMVDGTLRNWRADTTTAGLQGNLDATGDLAELAALFDFEGLWGDLKASGPVRVDGKGLRFEAALASGGFGFGDWATPYNVPVNATTTIEVKPDGTFRMTPVALTLGEELRAEAAAIEIVQTDNGTTLDISALDLAGSLRTLVVLGLFASAEGSSTVQASQLSYANERWQGDFAVTLDASELMLPGEVAKLADTMLSGTFGYDNGLSGGGRLNIGLLNTGGIELGDFGSDVRAEASHLHFDSLNTDLFYGRIEGNGRVEVFNPLFPFHLEVEATDLDLARFTETFEPPDTELTGLVSGEVMIDLDLEGLKDLRVDLHAPDGITLNRSAVELILLSQQVGDFTAGGTLSRVVQQVIGESPHRPFESASLQLGFEDGRITGVALLQSRALNLTVDIKADPGALAEALRIRTN